MYWDVCCLQNLAWSSLNGEILHQLFFFDNESRYFIWAHEKKRVKWRSLLLFPFELLFYSYVDGIWWSSFDCTFRFHALYRQYEPKVLVREYESDLYQPRQTPKKKTFNLMKKTILVSKFLKSSQKYARVFIPVLQCSVYLLVCFQ